MIEVQRIPQAVFCRRPGGYWIDEFGTVPFAKARSRLGHLGGWDVEGSLVIGPRRLGVVRSFDRVSHALDEHELVVIFLHDSVLQFRRAWSEDEPPLELPRLLDWEEVCPQLQF